MSASATPIVPPSPTPVPPTARTGEIHDAGAVRKDSVRSRTWTASGAAKVLGDVEVDLADLSGLVSIRGGLTGGSVTSKGTLDVGGAVRLTGALATAGTASFARGVEAAEIDLHGATTVGGSLRATGRLRWKGTLEVDGDAASGQIEFEGRARIGGALTATEITGRLRDESTIGSIRGERVRISRAPRLFGGGRLNVLTIEAAEVELEGVVAQHLRAQRIVLGPGCQIAEVEGTITRQHSGAHVGPVSRSPAPYGLTR